MLQKKCRAVPTSSSHTIRPSDSRFCPRRTSDRRSPHRSDQHTRHWGCEHIAFDNYNSKSRSSLKVHYGGRRCQRSQILWRQTHTSLRTANGKSKKLLHRMAENLNENRLFQHKLSWKQIQDRSKRLEDQYNAYDQYNQRQSGVCGGEIGQLANWFMTVCEARDAMAA